MAEMLPPWDFGGGAHGTKRLDYGCQGGRKTECLVATSLGDMEHSSSEKKSRYPKSNPVRLDISMVLGHRNAAGYPHSRQTRGTQRLPM